MHNQNFFDQVFSQSLPPSHHSALSLEQQLKRQLDQQAALARLGQLALAKETSFEQLLDEVCQLLVRLFDVEFSLVSELVATPSKPSAHVLSSAYDLAKSKYRAGAAHATEASTSPAPTNKADNDQFLLKAGVGWQPGIIGQAIIKGGTLSQAGYTLQVNQPVLMADIQTENRFVLSPIHAAHGIVSALTVVIGGAGKSGERPYGVLGTASKRPLNFMPEDLQCMQSLANVIAAAYQRKKAEEALLESEIHLRQAQKMESVGRLAGGIAHDFNNLLTAINGYSELLLMTTSKDVPMYADLLEINKAGERAASLTRQLLAFSRQQVLQPRVINLNQVISDTDKLLGRLLREDIELVTRLDPALGEVLADPTQIEQVLINLAVNACDAMTDDQSKRAANDKAGGKLIIETCNVELDESYRSTAYPVVKSGQYVMLAISDNGSGMDKATLEKIFDPFFTTKGPGKGTGLGLSTVYGIVQQSEGYIWVYSEPGVGTTFKIYLPQLTKKKKELAAPVVMTDNPINHNTSPKARPGHILVVEDDVLVRDLVKRILEEAGYRVEEASNGAEALAKLQTAATTSVNQSPETSIAWPDLIITDIIMPQLSGQSLVEQLRDRQKYNLSASAAHEPGKEGVANQTEPAALKVLCMSGYTDHAVEPHLILEMCDAFLQKPFTPSALLGQVARLLG